jgi:hypothetical protein
MPLLRLSITSVSPFSVVLLYQEPGFCLWQFGVQYFVEYVTYLWQHEIGCNSKITSVSITSMISKHSSLDS